MFAEVDCKIFNHPKPMTMALSVLVVIEMSNAINRYRQVAVYPKQQLVLYSLIVESQFVVKGTPCSYIHNAHLFMSYLMITILKIF